MNFKIIKNISELLQKESNFFDNMLLWLLILSVLSGVLFSFLTCGWIFVFIISIVLFIMFLRTTSNEGWAFVVWICIIVSIGIYDVIEPIFKGYNEDFSSQAHDLEIENSYEIQEFYQKEGYQAMWVGKLSDKIYVRASKKYHFPCCDTGRYDQFTESGKHLKQLKSYEEIPKVKFYTTTRDDKYIFLSPGYR